MNFLVRDLQLMMLNIFEVCEVSHRKGPTFLIVVNNITLTRDAWAVKPYVILKVKNSLGKTV